MKKLILILVTYLSCAVTAAQNVSLNIATPNKANSVVNTAKQFITGTTCKECMITVNGVAVKVYKTGVFVHQLQLGTNLSTFEVKAVNGKKELKQVVNYELKPLPAIMATVENKIESYSVEPSGNLQLQPGEKIIIKVKAKPGMKVALNNGMQLKEKNKSLTKGVAGYYEAEYVLKTSDKKYKGQFSLNLLDEKNEVLEEVFLTQKIEIFEYEQNVIGEIAEAYTPVYVGLGEDRLGGTKSGFLDSGVKVQIVGKYNKLYKIKLDQITHQYIPVDQISKITNDPVPLSLSNNITATGDSTWEYVRVSLNQRLPYLTKTLVQPNKILLHIYGATNNTNWLMQFPEKMKTIADVDLDQMYDHKLQIAVKLSDKQIWGYKTFYEGNTLVLAIRKKKENLAINNLTIAVDAGHGGSNDGAKGIAGKYEKEFTLLIAKEVERLLKSEGVKVLMTRTADESFENQKRLDMLRKRMPDVAISIHLNSAGDPLRVKGTSTYYKYNAHKLLSASIYAKMTQTGLTGWGNTGNFNFFLNSATEFPTALVETLFISNPEDEEKVHDPVFRTQMAQKIVDGIKDWLQQVQ